MRRQVITERDVSDAVAAGRREIAASPEAIITPLAADAIRRYGISVRAAPDQRAAQQNRPRVVVGADHGGFDYKTELSSFLADAGYEVDDVGTHTRESCDYPDIAATLAHRVLAGSNTLGVMIDGAGIGSAMACNKIAGIRAACAYNEFTAWNSRAHNNANVLTLGSRTLGIEVCKRVVTTFLGTSFEGGRHTRRVDKIGALEK